MGWQVEKFCCTYYYLMVDNEITYYYLMVDNDSDAHCIVIITATSLKKKYN